MLAGVVLAVISGVVWYSRTVAVRRQEPVVHIGYLPIYVDLPLFVAVDRGYFDRHNVRYDLVRFASSPEIGNSLVQGDIQIGASIAYTVVLATESRDPGKLRVFIVDSENKENYLSSIVVLEKSGIKTLADLRGKKVASFPGPTAVTFCKMVLEKYGFKPGEDVFVTELDVASHLSALESGLVDALFTYEPTATQAVVEKHAVKLLPGAVETEIMSPWQAGVWVVSTKFAAEHPSEARDTMAALYEAIDFIRQNPDEAKQSLKKFTSISEQVAKQTPNIPFAKLSEVNLEAFQQQADILLQRNVISKKIYAPVLLAPEQWVTGK